MQNSINTYNAEAEKAVISALLLEKEAIYEVVDFLKPEMFYQNDLGAIYSVILELEGKGADIDLVTVTSELKNNSEALSTVIDLSGYVSSAIHVETHARIVFQDYLRRKFAIHCTKSVSDANDMSKDVDDLISDHLYEVENLSDVTEVGNTVSMDKLTVEAYRRYEERAENARQGKPIGLHTGLNKLDNVLHGLRKGCVYIVAARPGMGKTALMLDMARKTAEQGNNVLIFSLEMPKDSLVDRMVVAHSGINSEAYKSGTLTPDEVLSAGTSWDQLGTLPIEINDSASMSVQRIRAQAKKMKRKGKCDVIFIDYLQLLDMCQMRGKSTNDEVSATSRAIKVLAKDLDVPIILLSQLNRGVEGRTDKRPMLSDLRDSGAIEQDADAVIFIHRDVYYSKHEADKNKCSVIIAKNREGRTGEIDIWVDDCITNFKDETPSAKYSNSYVTPGYATEGETPF